MDPTFDGWSTGTPAYYGDYIMAGGKPREGWGMEDNSATATAYSYHYTSSSSGYTGPLTGANTAIVSIGTTLSGVWQGTFTSITTFNVKQTVTIDTNNLFVKVHIDFYNVGSVPDSFYYVRTLEPQNERVMSGNDTTVNIIEHQLPDPAGLVVVSATGLTDPNAYVALGTKDPRAKCFIIKDSTLPGFGTFANIYAGDTTHYQYNDTLTSNVAIGLIYKIGVGPGDSSYLDYAYTFKGSIVDTIFDTLTIPLNTQSASNTGSIKVYPNPTNDVVNVTGLTSGNYLTLYDILARPVELNTTATTKTSQTISIAQLTPGIYMLAVRDMNGYILSKVALRKL